MDYQRKLGFGAVLSVCGGLGIVLSALLGWTQIGSPWSFILGFVFGIMSGTGVALSVSGFIDRRAQR